MPEEKINIKDVIVNVHKDGQLRKRTGKQLKKFLSLDHKTLSVGQIRNSIGKCLSTFDSVLQRDNIEVKE